MGFYNNEILAIFKDLPEIQNNRYNPVIRLNHLSISPTYIFKFKKRQVSSALLMSKLLVPLLVAFILVILWRWQPVTVFENFLEKKKVFQQKNYTTFIDSL